MSVLSAGYAVAQQNTDFSRVEVKITDLGNKTCMLQGAGGNVTVAIGSDGIIIMVDSQFGPMHDKIKSAIETISPLPVKYLINTHFHSDHAGGNGPFHKDGAIIVAQDNIRLRLADGTTNGITGNKTQPAPAEALPTVTYFGGTKTIEVGGRKAVLTHVNNAHGDTYVYFADANVLCTGDTFNNTKHYQSIDFANGGNGALIDRKLPLQAGNGSREPPFLPACLSSERRNVAGGTLNTLRNALVNDASEP